MYRPISSIIDILNCGRHRCYTTHDNIPAFATIRYHR